MIINVKFYALCELLYRKLPGYVDVVRYGHDFAIRIIELEFRGLIDWPPFLRRFIVNFCVNYSGTI